MGHTSVFFDALAIPDGALAAYHAGKEAMARQKYAEAIAHLTEALGYAESSPLFRARTLEQRGVCHGLLGEYEEAEADYEAALDSADDRHQQGRARAHLGDVANSRGQHDKALSLYQQALEEGLALNNLLVTGWAHRGLGVVNRRQGNTEQALSHLTQALAAFRQLGHALEQARVLTSIGRTRHARGEYQLAISAHNEALHILESLRERWRVVITLNDLGECYQALYAMADALAAHERALQLADEQVHGIRMIKPDIQRNLGVDLVESGQYEVGLSYLKQSLTGARRIGNREQEALGLFQLARTYLRRDFLEEAQKLVSDLDTLADTVGTDRYRALAAFLRGELAFARERRDEAIAALNEAMLYAQSSLDRGMLWKLHATMSHVVEEDALASVHAQIAADFVRQTAEPLQDEHLKESFLNAAPVVAVLEKANVDPDKF